MRASRIPGDSGGVGARIFFGHWRTRAEHTYAYARQPLSPTSSFASSPAHARTLAPRHPPTPSTASLATLTALSLLPLVQPFPVSCSFCRVTLTPPAPPIHRFAPRSPRHARPFLALALSTSRHLPSIEHSSSHQQSHANMPVQPQQQVPVQPTSVLPLIGTISLAVAIAIGAIDLPLWALEIGRAHV